MGLRLVNVAKKVWSRESNKYITEGARPAKFHQWGMESTEFDSGFVMDSVAIVEYEDGTVERVVPECVTFVHGEHSS